MDITTHHCYQQLVRELSEKYRARDSEVMELLHLRRKPALQARAEDMKRRLKACLTDADFVPCGLMARITSAVQCDGYRIENVVIQSLPACHIPVNVYVPDGARRHPAILVCLGHWPEGKQMKENQIMCANLALNGFLTATFDPVFQGERRLFSPEQLLEHFGPISDDMWAVNAHMVAGNLAYALDKDIAALFAWECRRVVDYLFTRDDVDTSRVGVTGQSGGGTQSLYAAAADERIGYCSPIQCISKQALILEQSGIGDCEQSMRGISRETGFDYPDLLWSVFPRPLMVSSGRDDFFFLPGVRQVEAEMSLLYERAAEKADYEHNIAPCAHAVSAEARQLAYDWFCKKMLGRVAMRERDTGVLPDEKLRCFAQGFTTKTTLDVYADFAKACFERRPPSEALRTELAALLPITDDPYTIEPLDTACSRFLLHTTHRTALCELTQAPSKVLTVLVAPDDYDGSKLNAPCLLRVTPWGMQTTYAKRRAGYDEETCLFYASTVLGKNILAERVNQLVSAITYALERTGCERVHIVGARAGAMVALPAACLDARIQKTALLDCFVSLDDMFGKDMYFLPETSILPGLLRLCDIPALARLANATFVNPRDYNDCPAGDGRVRCIVADSSMDAAALFLQT